MRARSRLAAAALAFATLAAGCSSTGNDTTATPATTSPAPAQQLAFPGAQWVPTDPASVGLDPAALDDLNQYAADAGSNCVAVIKDGHLVDEAYWNGTDASTDQEIFSATKSITSTLVGIAQADGDLRIDQPASDFLTEWQGTPSQAVTIRNLLSNDSGRHWDLDTDYAQMAFKAADKTAFALGLDQQYPPGTHWNYNNSAIQTLELVLARATGQDMVDYATQRLFEPIGMTSTIKRDEAGNPLAFMGAQASCRDMARFGLLFLAQGNWDGDQIVPADWVTQATTPSTELNRSYGFLWWLNQPGPVLGAVSDTVGQGPIWPDLPTDAYSAVGLGNQIALVIPDEGLVVVRLGPASTSVASQGDLVDGLGKRALAAVGAAQQAGQ